MSNETKRDVFEDTLDAYDDSRPYPHPGYDSPAKLLDRYNAALPDDLPVIPKAVSEYIKNLHKFHRGLVDVFGMVRDLGITRTEPTGVLVWVAHNTDTFALAWVLGVWRVKETGEIVKVEAEK
ncbi:hypothetical protein NJN40_08850 [Lacticaseibacillus paracasei]|uniref:hypothetical protein n=1 Tax=Lacticaseibacillus paracasei TaxID=1597 RepID=UPI0020A15062|nr:hypothetical protein [Lacticaseibacillus paracasei]UVH22830.1 hypothetical protein NJN40_08850 [Lacticaseibacillus paracasei]